MARRPSQSPTSRVRGTAPDIAPMIRNRSRLITFRLSEDEYERLRGACEAHGARSVSAFVRWSLIWMASNWERRLRDLLFLTAPSDRQVLGPASSGSAARGVHANGAGSAIEPGGELQGAIAELRAEIESLTKVVQDLHSNRRRDSHD